MQFVSDNENLLSVCINTVIEKQIYTEYIIKASKEKHNGNTYFGPVLHLTYIEESPNALPIFFMIIGILALLGAGGGLGYLFHKRKRKLRD